MGISKFLVMATSAAILLGNSLALQAGHNKHHNKQSVERNTKCYGISRCKVKGKHKICKSKDSSKFMMVRSEKSCKKLGGTTMTSVDSKADMKKDEKMNETQSTENNSDQG